MSDAEGPREATDRSPGDLRATATTDRADTKQQQKTAGRNALDIVSSGARDHKAIAVSDSSGSAADAGSRSDCQSQDMLVNIGNRGGRSDLRTVEPHASWREVYRACAVTRWRP